MIDHNERFHNERLLQLKTYSEFLEPMSTKKDAIISIELIIQGLSRNTNSNIFYNESIVNYYDRTHKCLVQYEASNVGILWCTKEFKCIFSVFGINERQGHGIIKKFMNKYHGISRVLYVGYNIYDDVPFQ